MIEMADGFKKEATIEKVGMIQCRKDGDKITCELGPEKESDKYKFENLKRIDLSGDNNIEISKDLVTVATQKDDAATCILWSDGILDCFDPKNKEGRKSSERKQ